MDFLISSAYAQAADAAAQPNPLLSFLPLLVLFAVFYFMLIRPQMRRAKEQRSMITALAKGDEVVTNGGIAGRIEELGDSFVTLLCRDEQHAQVVLKYVRPDAPRDAYRRLDNEVRLLQQIPTEWPLRLLQHRASAAGYLVTELDSGRLLRPATMDEEHVVRGVATALALFQKSARGQRLDGIRDREAVGRYYLKVLVKHLLHLWPAELSLWQCCRAMVIVVAALPALLRRSAPAHGDFLPTNLLYHDSDGSVTFTDLEAFMRDYYQHARTIYNMTELLSERLSLAEVA